jgi:hypothetical protein
MIGLTTSAWNTAPAIFGPIPTATAPALEPSYGDSFREALAELRREWKGRPPPKA